MDIGTIDYWANSGRSPLHRASALSKLVASGLLVAAVVTTNDIFALLSIFLTMGAALALARIPWLQAMALALYPGFFALLFALSQWNGFLLGPALIIGKAVTAASVMVVLITTTPYPHLFAALRHLLPSLVADAFFLTYRSLFLLLELLGNLLTALRLRGGISRGHYLGNIRPLAFGLGLLLVRAVALSERMYQVLRLRGYSGRLAAGDSWRRFADTDVLPVGVGVLILSAVLLLRWVPGASQYNGYLLTAAVLSLLASLGIRLKRPVSR